MENITETADATVELPESPETYKAVNKAKKILSDPKFVTQKGLRFLLLSFHPLLLLPIVNRHSY